MCLVYEEADEHYNVDLGLLPQRRVHRHHQRGEHLDRRPRAAL
jgi:hypothetical protein